MDWQIHKLKTVVEEDRHGWESLDKNWWKISYASVSWSYPSQIPHSFCWQAAKPPFYHGNLISSVEKGVDASQRSGSRPRGQLADQVQNMTLNHLLPGVQCVEEALSPYEHAVGFFAPEDYRGFPSKRDPLRDISIPVDDVDLARSKAQWDKFEEDLLAPVVEEIAVKPPLLFKPQSAESSPSSSLDDFDQSAKSPSGPTTPQSRSSDVVVDIKEAPPLRASPDRHLNAGRPLNASASSFIPTLNESFTKPFIYPEPITSAPLLNTPHPYFNLHTPHPATQDVFMVNPASEAAVIPPFLQRLSQTQSPPLPSSSRRRANTSRTREIIDRLRLSSQARASGTPSPVPTVPETSEYPPRPKSAVVSGLRSRRGTPAHHDGSDGWIELTDSSFQRTEDRVRETRNLFLSFTKRRSASASPSPSQTLGPNSHESQDSFVGQEFEIPRTLSPTPMTPPATTSSTSSLPSVASLNYNNDGWIEGPAITSPPLKVQSQSKTTRSRTESTRSRHRKRKSSQASASTTSSSVQSIPAVGMLPGQHFAPPLPASMPMPSPAYAYSPPAPAPSTVPFPVMQSPMLPYQPALSMPPHMMPPMMYASYMHQFQYTQMHMGGAMPVANGPARRAARLMGMPEVDGVY